GGKFTGFVGASYFDETANRDLHYQADERQLYALLSPTLNAQTGGALPIIPLLNPDLTPNTTSPIFGFLPFPLNPDHRETFGNDVDIRAFEVFADGTWRFNDAWSLTLGLRGSHESVEYGYHADAGNGSGLGYALSARGTPACAPLTLCTNLLFPATAGRLSDSGSFNSWVGRAVLGYKLGDNVNTYASVSRGRRPNMINVSDLGSEEVEAEIVWSYELGMKGSAGDGRFVYDLSLFYYDYNNFQASVQNDTPPPFFITKNAGKAHALGFEASLFGRFSDNVDGWLNYGFIDGGFNAFDDDGVAQELAGNRFRMTPKQSFSLGLDWRMPLQNGDTLYVRPSYNWRSQVFFEDDNQPGIEQDGYGLFNLRAGWRFADRWEVALWGNNLANKEYLTDAGNTGLLFGIPTVIPGADRSYGVTLRATF
ncbi:MAG: TonB-dependent receptor, partial [Lysobacter sp.]|nr:TonB-dependent receptor [Lysobacter sp.]